MRIRSLPGRAAVIPGGALAARIGSSLSSNLLAGIISIASLPLLVRALGTEGYGLVAFYMMLQTWFWVVDLGLGQALSRQTARVREGAVTPGHYNDLFRAVRAVFLAGGLTVSLLVLVASGWVSQHWLEASTIPVDDVQLAVALMGIGASLRWMSGMYRGVVTGYERFVWLSGFNVLVAVARFLLVIPVLSFFTSEQPIVVFMVYQVAVSAIELLVLRTRAAGLREGIQHFRGGGRRRVRFAPVKAELAFSLNYTFAAFVWILVTQADRVTLSGVLALDEYGVFALAATLAAGVNMIAQPVASVFAPRLTRFAARGEGLGLRGAYIQAGQVVSWIVVPVALSLALVAEPAVRLWTQDPAIAQTAAPIVSLYAVGNMLLALSGMAYYLQFALGTLRLHTLGSALLAVVLVPLQVGLALVYGGAGAGIAWVLVQLVAMLCWIPFVHHRLLPGVNSVWFRDVVALPVVLVSAVLLAVVGVSTLSGPWPDLVAVALPSAAAGAVAALALVRLRRSQPEKVVLPGGPMSDSPSAGESGIGKELPAAGRPHGRVASTVQPGSD